MVYNKEDLKTDENWLREQGVETEEVTDFLVGLIEQGFMMNREEFVKFKKSVERIGGWVKWE